MGLDEKQIIMKKLILLLLLIPLVSCDNTQSKKQNADRVAGYSLSGLSSFLTNNKFSEFDGVLTFEKNGKCKFFQENKRTSQVEWNFSGTYTIDNTKFDDNGEPYWYVDIDWEKKRIISDFYVVDKRGFLIDLSNNDKNAYVGTVKRDSYGPVLNSWNYKNQGFNGDSRAVRPIK